jgi:curved DNA-binding protein CbpA
VKDYYEVLGVKRSAASGKVKAAYDARMRRAMRLRDEERIGEERRLKEAFAILSNPSKRAEFDASLLELDAKLTGSGSNAPLVVGIVVVALTAAAIGYFVSERSKVQKSQRMEEQRAAAQKK